MTKLNIIDEDIRLDPLQKDVTGFSTKNFKVFKNLINLISDTTDEVNFDISDDGLNISCMDSSHVSYLCINLPNHFFEEFNCQQNKKYGVNMKSLSKIFTTVKVNIGLSVIFNNDTIDFLLKSNNIDKNYRIKQMTIDTDNLSIPEIEYDYIIDLKSTDFYNIMHEVQDISDGCEIKIKQKILQFRAEGIIGSVKMKYIPNEIIDNTVNKYCKLAFTSKYLYNFSKGRNLSPDMKIYIMPDTPMKLVYELENATIINYIAPKII